MSFAEQERYNIYNYVNIILYYSKMYVYNGIIQFHCCDVTLHEIQLILMDLMFTTIILS